MLAMDEMVDNGMILEADPATLVSRVALRTDDIPLGEQTVAQVPVLCSLPYYYYSLKCLSLLIFITYWVPVSFNLNLECGGRGR
jgi:hypothetical protein